MVIEFFFNFFVVKGVEFFNMYVGEFECVVCIFFEWVCVVFFFIIFFDEIDFIVG